MLHHCIEFVVPGVAIDEKIVTTIGSPQATTFVGRIVPAWEDGM
jgi:hypothetical protein